MRIGLGIPNRCKVPSALPVSDYLTVLNSDYPVGGMNYQPAATVIGCLFTNLGATCNGVEFTAPKKTGADPFDIRFDLWNLAGTNIASEIVPFSPTMYSSDVSTTVAFGSHPLVVGTKYIASVCLSGPFGPFPYSQIAPGYLPKLFPKYTIEVGTQVFVGAFVGFPGINDPNYAPYVQPLIT